MLENNNKIKRKCKMKILGLKCVWKCEINLKIPLLFYFGGVYKIVAEIPKMSADKK